ncbi:diacylglycerol O-acyltransferase 1 [Aspergillus tubingensis]|nr:diacylglycerol O-acyltransferase 1 [Aspergillus tubingensis]
MSPSDTPPGLVPSGQENAALQPTATEGSLKGLWKRASLPYKARSSVMPDGAAPQAAQETMKESRGPSIRWAPLNVGLERRLQTLVVLCHTLTIAILLTAFFFVEYALGMGIASVSRESCENLLSKGGIDGEGMGRAITIVIGGARESLDALPHTLRLVLKRRKGFIKLAIHTGADLVPVLAFGENDLYEQVRSENHPLIHKLQMLVKHTLGFTIPLFHARGVFNYDVGLMPYRRPLNIVVGRPIHVVQQRDRGKIDDDYINHLHSLYVQELERIWEEWKDKYAKDRTSEIEIVA